MERTPVSGKSPPTAQSASKLARLKKRSLIVGDAATLADETSWKKSVTPHREQGKKQR